MLFLILLYIPQIENIGNESTAIFLIHMTVIWLLLDLLVEETRKNMKHHNLARKVWRYQRDKQNAYIAGQTIQWVKAKGQKDK